MSCPARTRLPRTVRELVLAGALASTASAQEVPQDVTRNVTQDGVGATHDLRIELSAERPLYAELRSDSRVTLELAGDGKTRKQELRHQTRLDLVDELLSRDAPAPGDLDVRRTYVSWQDDATEGRGKPAPGERSFNGTSALVTRRGEELGLELVDRYAPKAHLEDLLAQAASVEWLELPQAARVGEPFEIAPLGLARLLMGGGSEVASAHGKLTLRSVDELGVATLEGPLLVLMEDEEGRGTLEGTLALQVDTRARAPRSAEWKAKSLLRMEVGGATVDAKGTFEARIAVVPGDAAREALGRAPVYRDVPRPLERAPVVLDLPSHWYRVEDAEKDTFRTSVHGAEALVTLELSFHDITDEAFDAVVDAAVSQLKQQVRLVGARSVPSPFGKGRSMRYVEQSDGAPEATVAIEFYPCGKGRLMKVALGGETKAFEAEFRAWQTVLRSFELRE